MPSKAYCDRIIGVHESRSGRGGGTDVGGLDCVITEALFFGKKVSRLEKKAELHGF